MIKVAMQTIILVVAVLITGQAMAETDVNITGQVRVRSELSDRSFDSTAKAQQYTYLRTRVMADAAIDDNTHAVVQFQDSRTLGAGGFSGDHTTGDAKNVDLHQAYLQVDHLWENGPGLKAGRFEVNLGNQRVFGSVGWHNVGRSWEGFQAWLDRENVRFDAFWLKKMELDDVTGNTDYDIFGAYATIKPANLDLFAFFEHDAYQDDSTPVTNAPTGTFYSHHKRLKRLNLGLHYKRTYQQFDFDVNAVYQTGKMQQWDEPVPDSLASVEHDIAALMFTFEGGYTFDRSCKPRLGLGIDYASGDDNLIDTDHKAYNNLYYTGHKFRGYMDYFLGSGSEGLMDVMLRLKVNPTEGWTVKGDLHLFRTATEYADFSDTTATTRDVGMEFDLGVSTVRVAGVNLAAGTSVFLPSESYVGMADPDPTFWSYFQATANF
ncbi:MAG: alginate export family protein [bacterium]